MQTLEASSCPWPLGAILPSSPQPGPSVQRAACSRRQRSLLQTWQSLSPTAGLCQLWVLEGSGTRRGATLPARPPGLLADLGLILERGFPLAGRTRRLLASRPLNGLRLCPSIGPQPQRALLPARAPRAASRIPALTPAQQRLPQLLECMHVCMKE